MTPAERLRQHQRALAKAQRELDRERTKLEQGEKKLIMDIKKSAKAGQMVRSLGHLVSPTLSGSFLLKGCGIFLCVAERLQGHGKGLGSHTPIRSKVLPDAHATAGGRIAHSDVAQ